jgi:hypothetical protein
VWADVANCTVVMNNGSLRRGWVLLFRARLQLYTSRAQPYRRKKRKERKKERKKEERGAVNETHIRIELKQFQ